MFPCLNENCVLFGACLCIVVFVLEQFNLSKFEDAFFLRFLPLLWHRHFKKSNDDLLQVIRSEDFRSKLQADPKLKNLKRLYDELLAFYKLVHTENYPLFYSEKIKNPDELTSCVLTKELLTDLKELCSAKATSGFTSICIYLLLQPMFNRFATIGYPLETVFQEFYEKCYALNRVNAILEAALYCADKSSAALNPKDESGKVKKDYFPIKISLSKEERGRLLMCARIFLTMKKLGFTDMKTCIDLCVLFEKLEGPIENYYLQSGSAGPSTRNREELYYFIMNKTVAENDYFIKRKQDTDSDEFIINVPNEAIPYHEDTKRQRKRSSEKKSPQKIADPIQNTTSFSGLKNLSFIMKNSNMSQIPPVIPISVHQATERDRSESTYFAFFRCCLFLNMLSFDRGV